MMYSSRDAILREIKDAIRSKHPELISNLENQKDDCVEYHRTLKASVIIYVGKNKVTADLIDLITFLLVNSLCDPKETEFLVDKLLLKPKNPLFYKSLGSLSSIIMSKTLGSDTITTILRHTAIIDDIASAKIAQISILELTNRRVFPRAIFNNSNINETTRLDLLLSISKHSCYRNDEFIQFIFRYKTGIPKLYFNIISDLATKGILNLKIIEKHMGTTYVETVIQCTNFEILFEEHFDVFSSLYSILLKNTSLSCCKFHSCIDQMTTIITTRDVDKGKFITDWLKLCERLIPIYRLLNGKHGEWLFNTSLRFVDYHSGVLSVLCLYDESMQLKVVEYVSNNIYKDLSFVSNLDDKCWELFLNIELTPECQSLVPHLSPQRLIALFNRNLTKFSLPDYAEFVRSIIYHIYPDTKLFCDLILTYVSTSGVATNELFIFEMLRKKYLDSADGAVLYSLCAVLKCVGENVTYSWSVVVDILQQASTLSIELVAYIIDNLLVIIDPNNLGRLIEITYKMDVPIEVHSYLVEIYGYIGNYLVKIVKSDRSFINCFNEWIKGLAYLFSTNSYKEGIIKNIRKGAESFKTSNNSILKSRIIPSYILAIKALDTPFSRFVRKLDDEKRYGDYRDDSLSLYLVLLREISFFVSFQGLDDERSSFFRYIKDILSLNIVLEDKDLYGWLESVYDVMSESIEHQAEMLDVLSTMNIASIRHYVHFITLLSAYKLDMDSMAVLRSFSSKQPQILGPVISSVFLMAVDEGVSKACFLLEITAKTVVPSNISDVVSEKDYVNVTKILLERNKYAVLETISLYSMRLSDKFSPEMVSSLVTAVTLYLQVDEGDVSVPSMQGPVSIERVHEICILRLLDVLSNNIKETDDEFLAHIDSFSLMNSPLINNKCLEILFEKGANRFVQDRVIKTLMQYREESILLGRLCSFKTKHNVLIILQLLRKNKGAIKSGMKHILNCLECKDFEVIREVKRLLEAVLISK